MVDAAYIEALDGAILQVVTTGQAFRLTDGTEVTRANLAEMRRLRAELKNELEASSSSGISTTVRRAVYRGNE